MVCGHHGHAYGTADRGGEGGASPGLKHTVFFDSVRVPAFNLIGGENNGWRVATTHLELEHGGGGIIRRNRVVDQFLEYAPPPAQRPDAEPGSGCAGRYG